MQIQVRPTTADEVSDVVRLHRLVLGYTLNAELGEPHLRRLYRGLLVSSHGVVLRAHDDGETQKPIIGFVSGTDDAAALQSDLIRTPGTRILLSLALGLAWRPWLVGKLIAQTLVNRPVIHQGKLVTASLLTIGVRPDYGRKGIGHQLVEALIVEFRRRGVRHFHLNTKSNNEHARRFYQGLGGRLIRSWRGNDIYLFVL